MNVGNCLAANLTSVNIEEFTLEKSSFLSITVLEESLWEELPAWIDSYIQTSTDWRLPISFGYGGSVFNLSWGPCQIYVTGNFCGRSHFTPITWQVHTACISHHPNQLKEADLCSPFCCRKSRVSWALLSDKLGHGPEPMLAQRTLSSASGFQRRTSFFRDIVGLR